MPYYIKNGTSYSVTDQSSLQLYDKLPHGNYIVQKTAGGEFFLNSVDEFKTHSKIYGNLDRTCKRIFTTFLSRDNATGVMLTGEKGSGKTLLAKLLSITGYETGIPTLIINAGFCGDTFNKFLQDIDQPCVILFDEFEKTYDSDQQEAILTLLDGAFPSKKLFVFTCNNKWRIDTHMRNRPGRIYYMIDFTGIDLDCIREYCLENLQDKSHADSICKLAGMFTDFNFDMLKALIEEMNRYGETPQEAIQLLNIKPEFGSTANYKVEFKTRDYNVVADSVSPDEWSGNPLNHKSISIDFCINVDDEDWESVEFDLNSLRKVDPKHGEFVFVKDGSELKLTRIVKESFNFKELI